VAKDGLIAPVTTLVVKDRVRRSRRRVNGVASKPR